MKRSIAILTVLILVLGLFAGCSSNEDAGLNSVTGGLGGNVSTNGGSAAPEDNDSNGEDQPETPDHSTQTPENSTEVPDHSTEVPDHSTQTPDSGDEDVYTEEEEKDYSDYITVVSYNIKSLQIDKLGVVAALKEMDGDIVGLQEVDHMNTRTSNEDQMKYLANTLGYPYYYWTNCTGNYGHGFLSRYLVKEVKEHTYSSFVGSEVRKYTRAVLDVEGTEVVFYNTHLTTGTWEQTGTQYKELLSAVYKEKGPTVVTGDFNLTLAEQRPRINTEEVFPLYGGDLMVIDHENYSYDNILIRNINDYYWNETGEIGTKILLSEASDHYPIYSYIKVK